jgi:hypothetical protein
MNVEQACELIADELRKAMKKHSRPMASAHEGYAVILEELDELWDEVKKQYPNKGRQLEEAIQVAAMAARFMIDVCCKETNGNKTDV